MSEEDRIYVKDTDRKISCGTCKSDCSKGGIIKNIRDKAEQCLYHGIRMRYYDWPRYQKNFKYSEWEPIRPEKKEHLPDELFEVDI